MQVGLIHDSCHSTRLCQALTPPGAGLTVNSCTSHNSATPFPANGTAHASNAKVLLGRGRLTNEKIRSYFCFWQKSLTEGTTVGGGKLRRRCARQVSSEMTQAKKPWKLGTCLASAAESQLSPLNSFCWRGRQPKHRRSDQAACPGL